MNERAESLAHTVLMKKKLQEVGLSICSICLGGLVESKILHFSLQLQVMQAQIMQELDEEMKLHCEEEHPPDTTDVSKDDRLGELD